MARRNFIRHQSTLPLRARTADAILRLMGGRKQHAVSHDGDSPAPVPVPEGAFAEEERYMINGVLTLAQRSLRSIMTPRGEISWVTRSRAKMKFAVSCSLRRTACSRSAAASWMKSSVSCGRKRCWWRWRPVRTSRHWPRPRRRLWSGNAGPDQSAGVLRRARGSFVIVTNEFGVVQGLVTPLDVLEAIAGEFPDADETPEIVADGDGWLIKGSTDLHALQQALGLDDLSMKMRILPRLPGW
jgi:CBS domain containing-hemolysin-like protein